MKKIFFIFMLVFITNTTIAYQEYIDKTLSGKKVSVIKIIIDGEHTLKIANSKSGDSISGLVKSVGGISGVNGGYFCPADYANCNGVNKSDMTKISNFETVNTSFIGINFNESGLFGIDEEGKLQLIPYYDKTNLETIRYGISNYPILLNKSENKINPDMIDKKMNTSGIKSFICKEDDKTMYMGTISNITVPEMPEYLKTNFSCTDAINLDSGGSLSMVYNNEVKRKNGRPIMDAFVVVKTKKPSFDKQKYDEILKKVYKNLDKIEDEQKLKDLEQNFKMKMKKYETNSLHYYVLNEIGKYLTNKLGTNI